MSGVVIQAHRCQPPAATIFLATQSGRTHNAPASAESDLLRSIRTAIRSSGTNTVKTTFSPFFAGGSEPWIDQELSWNDYCVVLSEGGVIKRKWDLSQEHQVIQYACIGKLLESTGSSERQPHGSAHYTRSKNEASESMNAIFGPFASLREEKKAGEDLVEEVYGVFIFLRSIGRVFLRNGMDYTFSLPFLVHKAWPLHPHGILIQRILDQAEVDEARATGDDPLPTMFTITSPFSEPAAVGVTGGVLGGRGDEPVALVDEEENCSKPLVTVPAGEEVVWVSSGVPNPTPEILVSFDADKGDLSIWRYVYLKPKDAPVPLTRTRRSPSRKRMSVPGTRRQSTTIDDLLEIDRRLPSSSQEMEFDDNFPPPFPPMSGPPPSTAAGITAQPSIPGRKRASLTRLDLSSTMDRMALGGQKDADVLITPVEHGRMKASYWAQKLNTHRLGGSQ
jgi:anaphase-promoting complex subunit 1